MNPRESALPRPVAMRLAAAEYGRCAEMFRSLSPAQWAMPTDCPAWDVRQMAAHMLGMAEMAASIRENLRQQRKATKVARSGGVYIDALTQLRRKNASRRDQFAVISSQLMVESCRSGQRAALSASR